MMNGLIEQSTDAELALLGPPPVLADTDKIGRFEARLFKAVGDLIAGLPRDVTATSADAHEGMALVTVAPGRDLVLLLSADPADGWLVTRSAGLDVEQEWAATDFKLRCAVRASLSWLRCIGAAEPVAPTELERAEWDAAHGGELSHNRN